MFILQIMGDGISWIDQIVEDSSHQWERIGPTYVSTMLRPNLPCRITAGEVDGQPVLYAAVGTNGTPRYWQWATLDQNSHQPLPQTEALRNLRRFLDLTLITSESEILGELAS